MTQAVPALRATDPRPARPSVDDYERRRRQAETDNEWGVSTIIVVLMASMVLAEMLWSAEVPFQRVPSRMKLVTWAAMAFHVAVLAAISMQRGYSPLRKYIIVVARMALLGCSCWAAWHHGSPTYGLLLPTPMFVVAIVLAVLSYSLNAVVLAGVLACLVYPAVSLVGPTWPTSVTPRNS